MNDAPWIAGPLGLLAVGLVGVSVACLIVGLVQRGHCRLWLLALAVPTPIYIFAFAIAFRDYEPLAPFTLRQAFVWLVLALAAFAWAASSGHQSWRLQWSAALLGPALPALSVLWPIALLHELFFLSS
jgi:hypothetical protein